MSELKKLNQEKLYEIVKLLDNLQLLALRLKIALKVLEIKDEQLN